MRLRHVVTALSFLATFASAQGAWTFRSSTTNPPADSPSIAFDGARGVTLLLARQGSLPIAGATFHAQLNHLPLVAPVFLFVGVSNTQYGPLPLPLDLSPLGLTGCSLRVSGDLLFPATNILGSGLWSFDIPLSLAGQNFFNQAIVVDPLANPGGLTLSNGAEARVGY